MQRRRWSSVLVLNAGGAGMRTLAELFLRGGCLVYGIEPNSSPDMDRLIAMGATIYRILPALPPHVDCVIHSVVTPEELLRDTHDRYAALGDRPALYSRSECLAAFTNESASIAVAGSYGKTITCSLLGCVLRAAGHDPTLLAGEPRQIGEDSMLVGGTGCFVVEADDYLRQFTALSPLSSIIVNIEHASQLDTFADFSARTRGEIFLNVSDPHAALLRVPGRSVCTFGFDSSGADFRATRIEADCKSVRMDVIAGHDTLGTLECGLLGRHNATNILAAASFALSLGVPFRSIQQALAQFRGVPGRCEVVGRTPDCELVVDHAHHPSEIAAMIDACRLFGRDRVVVVYLPYTYLEVREPTSEFVDAFAAADAVILGVVHSLRDQGHSDDALRFVHSYQERYRRTCKYVPNPAELLNEMADELRPGTTVAVAGMYRPPALIGAARDLLVH